MTMEFNFLQVIRKVNKYRLSSSTQLHFHTK